METEEKPKKPMGRPPKWDSPKKLVKQIEKYFENCEETKKIPSKAGLCVSLKTTRDVLLDYEKNRGEEFSNAIKDAYFVIEEAWVQRLNSNAPTGAIFYLKNAFSKNYRDRHETDITSKGERIGALKELNEQELRNLAAGSESRTSEKGTG